MKVNRYTQTVIQPRATPNMVDQGAITDAGSTFGAIAQGADMAFNYIEKERQAVNATKVNNSIISYKKDLLDASETFRQQNMATPEDASKRFEDVSRKISQKYADSLQDEQAKQAFQSTVKNVDLGIYESNLNWERNRNVTLSAERVEDAANKINTIAYRYGQDGRPLDDVRRDIEATVIAESTFLAPEVIANSIETMERGVVTNYMQAQLDIGAHDKVKNQLDSGEYDDILGADGLKKLYKITNVEKKRQEAEFTAKQKNILNNEYRNMVEFQNHGIDFDRDQANDMAERSRNLGDESMAQNIKMRMDTQDIVSDFVAEPLEDQSKRISSMVEDLTTEQTPENLFKFKAIQEAFQAKQNAISKGNAFEYYEQAGVINKLAPLRVNDPQAFINDFALRKNAQRQIYDRDGIVVPPLSKQEMNVMAETYNDLPAKDRMQYLSTFANVFDETDASSVAQVMADDEPALAGIMAIIKENPKRAEDAILGSQREKLVSRNEIVEEMNKLYSDAVSDPQALNSIIDIVHNAYTEEAFRNGESVGNPDTIKDVANSIIGEKINYGNTSVLPFRKPNNEFISEGEFKRLTKNTNIDLLKTRLGKAPHMRGEEINDDLLQDMLKNWSLVTTGDGIYELRNPWDSNQVLIDADGFPYEFNFKELASDVDTRSMIQRGSNALFEKATSLVSILPEDE